MDLGIGNDSLKGGEQPSSSKMPNLEGKSPLPGLQKDAILSSQENSFLTSSVLSPSVTGVNLQVNAPILPGQLPNTLSFQDAMKEMQQTLNLPTGTDISKLLTPELQQMLQQIFEETGEEFSKFFEMLSKMLPFSLLLLNGMPDQDGMEQRARLKEAIGKLFSEIAAELKKHGDLSSQNQPLLKMFAQQSTLGSAQASSFLQEAQKGAGLEALQGSLSKSEMYQQLEQIKQSLAKMIASGDSSQVLAIVTEEPRLIKQLAELHFLPPSYQGSPVIPIKILQQILLQIQGVLGGEPGALDSSMDSLSQLFNTCQVFSPAVQPQVMRTMIGSQAFFSSGDGQGILGPHSQKLAFNLADNMMGLSQKMGIVSDNPLVTRAGSEYLSRVFGELLVTGAVVGKMMIDRGDGKWAEGVVLNIQAKTIKELGILDLIPFSFMAFFPPLLDMRQSRSKELKEASDALMQLVRLLMKLTLALAAIYTGGKKIGEKGMALLLKEYSEYLAQTLDDLIFSLKKIHEIFGVAVSSSLACCLDAKNALLSGEYSGFWLAVFRFLSESSDLKAFLEEKDQLDSLYGTVQTLLKDFRFDAESTQM